MNVKEITSDGQAQILYFFVVALLLTLLTFLLYFGLQGQSDFLKRQDLWCRLSALVLWPFLDLYGWLSGKLRKFKGKEKNDEKETDSGRFRVVFGRGVEVSPA